MAPKAKTKKKAVRLALPRPAHDLLREQAQRRGLSRAAYSRMTVLARIDRDEAAQAALARRRQRGGNPT